MKYSLRYTVWKNKRSMAIFDQLNHAMYFAGLLQADNPKQSVFIRDAKTGKRWPNT